MAGAHTHARRRFIGQEFDLLDRPGRANEWAVHGKRLAVGIRADQLNWRAYRHIFRISASPSSLNDDSNPERHNALTRAYVGWCPIPSFLGMEESMKQVL